jgi:hypothetical protein
MASANKQYDKKDELMEEQLLSVRAFLVCISNIALALETA